MDSQRQSSGYLKYMWLIVGCVLTVFIGMRWNVPIAAWLAPVFLIRFCRSQDKWYKTLVIVPLLALAAFAKLHGGWDLPVVAEIGLGLVLAAPMLIALYLDRTFARRISTLGATLVYPLVYTTLEYLFGLTPVGTSLSIGVTQFEFLSFIQLASITSIWGISFIISWFATTVNALWESGFDIKKALKPVSVFAAICILVLSFGGLRLIALRPEVETVRIGGVSVVQLSDYWAEIIDEGTPEDVAHQYDEEFQTLKESAFAESLQAVRVGAKIVFWAEANVMLHPGEEAVFLERAKAFAREHEIYFMPTMLVLKYGETYGDNKLVMISPDGEIAFSYEKTMSWYESNSDGILHVVDTPYGRISAAICFDMDFPRFIHQTAGEDVDIMLVPAFDWEQIKTFHTQVGLMRGIENGFSVMRQTNKGMSIAIDYQGRVLAYQDFFTTPNRTLVVDVPTQGVGTVYGAMGDWSVYMMALFSLCVIMWDVFRRRVRRGSQVSGS